MIALHNGLIVGTPSGTGTGTSNADLVKISGVVADPKSYTYGASINQWATSATASSDRGVGVDFAVTGATGAPRTGAGFEVGDNAVNNTAAWVEVAADRAKANTLTLTYDKDVYLESATVREGYGEAGATKIEVWDGTNWQTLVDKTSGTVVGGTITGQDIEIKVSDILLTPAVRPAYKTNKIRITVGNSVDQWNYIDAVKLTGSESRTEDPSTYKIDYSKLENKPTIPAATQISDNLTSNSNTRALSANQGRVLKQLVDAKPDSTGGTATSVEFEKITGLPGIFDPVPSSFNYSATVSQWATGASAEKTYKNATTGDYAPTNMIGAPTSTLGATQSAFRQGWLINDTAVWVELTYDTPVYLKSVIAREVYNIKTMHKLDVFKDGSFVTVWQRDINTDANETGGIISNEVIGKYSDTTITLTNILDYKVDKIRLYIGETTPGWNGIDSVQLNGSETQTKIPFSIRIDYSKLQNKPIIPAATQISDNLNSNSNTIALSANQGRVLKELIGANPNSSGASVAFKDITGLPTAFEVLPSTDTYSANINQWAESATASSEYSTTIYTADNLVGSPSHNANAGRPTINSGTDSWAENNADVRKVNQLTLIYNKEVYIKEVTLIELNRGGTASKIEVDNNGTFVTVWSRDVNTGANETGGVISGGSYNTISHSKITLDNYTDFLSKKIRISVGLTTSSDQHQHIDAIQLTGSETKTENPATIVINYNALQNIPTIPAPTQIGDNLTSNSDTIALSANQGRVLKELIDAKPDASGNSEETFEGILSNIAQYDYVVSYYATSTTANSGKIKKKVFAVPGGTNLTNITATYNHVAEGYNSIVLSGGVPASITKKRKRYVYENGALSGVLYS